MTNVRIRLAAPQERDALEALQWRASLANDADRPHLEANPDAIELPQEQIDLGQVLVAEIDGAIAGFAVFVREEGHAELDGLFVEPELWRKGIGAALVEKAKEWTNKKGCGRLRLRTNVKRVDAHRFYSGLGFTELKEQKVFEIAV